MVIVPNGSRRKSRGDEIQVTRSDLARQFRRWRESDPGTRSHPRRERYCRVVKWLILRGLETIQGKEAA